LLAQRLRTAVREQQKQRINTLDGIEAALAHLNPEATLARGFAIIRDSSGRLVTDAADLHQGQTINLRLARGEADASVLRSTATDRPIAT
jgi:exodeoxyribonuclease VII large subunit